MQSLQLTACRIDLGSGLVEPGGEHLTPRELELLRYLAARPRQVIARAELLQQAFGYAASAQSRAVDKAMVTLRKKVEQDPAAPDHLLTAERAGYRFEPLSETGQLVGRAPELAQIAQRLARPGLVTLHGPGGVGKTALAQRAAQAWAKTTGRAARLCRMGEGSTRADLLRALAVGLEITLGPSAEEQLGHAVAARGEILLVLDSFEEGVAHADLLGQLLQRAPQLHLLLTSRVAAGLPQEQVLPVRPLLLAEAVQLLAMRASERGQPTDPEGLELLAERLDRLPLALELAVPWLGVLGAQELAERLAHPLALPGQDGLRRMLARSWQLLDQDLRLALAELSVFRGPFDAERASAVLSPARDGRGAIELLEGLLRASLLQRTASGGRVWLSLLDTVRAYAAEQLQAAGEAEEARARREHARYFARLYGPQPDPDLARDLADVVEATRQATRLAEYEFAVECLGALNSAFGGTPMGVLRPLAEGMLARDLPDLIRGRTLILHAWSLQRAGEMLEGERLLQIALPLVQDEPAQRLAALLHLGWNYVQRGDLAQGTEIFAEAHQFAIRPGHRGAVLLGEAHIARNLGELSRAAALLREAFAQFQRARMPLKAAGARLDLGVVLSHLGDREGARAALQAALETCEKEGGSHFMLRIENVRMALATLEGDDEAYLRSCQRLVEANRAAGRRGELARWLSNLGYGLMMASRHEEAREVLVEAKQLAEEAGLTKLAGNAANHMGQLLAREGHLEDAEVELLRGCALLEDCGERFHLADTLCALAQVQHRQGRIADAERSLARASALCEALGLRPESGVARDIERTILALRAIR